MIYRYDQEFPEGTPDTSIELYCFRENCGNGRFAHARNAIDLIWNVVYPNTFIWNDFSEMLIQSYCENKWVTVTGAGATWKTTSTAMWCLLNWYASPKDTAIIVTSTTLDGLRRRIWKEISKFYRLRAAVGNMVQSRNCVQYEKGHDDAGIFGLATDKGEVDKAIGKIIGFHATNMIVAVDEMPYTPEAIVEACVNLESGSKRFQFIGLGNADDELDPHGRMCEPKNGWDSISVDSERWETKRGVCIHLDGLTVDVESDHRELQKGSLPRESESTLRVPPRIRRSRVVSNSTRRTALTLASVRCGELAWISRLDQGLEEDHQLPAPLENLQRPRDAAGGRCGRVLHNLTAGCVTYFFVRPCHLESLPPSLGSINRRHEPILPTLKGGQADVSRSSQSPGRLFRR
jgi:hypothetical protein